MSVRRAAIARFCLPFRKAIRLPGGQTLSERLGAIVRVELDTGEIGWGEISPLPPRHTETLDESLASLQLALQRGKSPTCRSAAFGLSCAVAVAQADKELGLEKPEPGLQIGVNALFTGGPAEAERLGRAGVFAGYRTIKVKVGRVDARQDIAAVQALLANVEPEVRLRLDANRRLSFDRARRLIKALDRERIEYLEEPLTDPVELPELYRQLGVPIAVDETLSESSAHEDVLGAPGIDVQVVKPSLLGDVGELGNIITRGRINSMDTVISSAFESGYTLFVLGRMAQILPTGERDHGLATTGIFARDIIRSPEIRDGQLALDGPIPVPELEFTPLEM